MNFITLEKHSLWFHGSTADFDPEEIGDGEPVWFSDDFGVAYEFSGEAFLGLRGHASVYVYRLLHDLEVVLIEDHTEFKKMIEELGLDPWESGHYEIVPVLCDAFNGWHIPTNYQDPRSRRGFGSDTLICDPWIILSTSIE